jgi:predicted Rossmann fold nucleotide-binding protein DprA/Smf involved in DNA uptake
VSTLVIRERSAAYPCGEYATVLCALYLKGLERPFQAPRRAWRAVLSALRAAEAGPRSAARALRAAGFELEAMILEAPRTLSSAESVREQGEALCATDPGYPTRWLRKLGPGAPPAIWKSAPLPPGPFLTIVGSRKAPPEALRFSRECAKAAVRLGFSVWSGGAEGCDAEAARGALLASEGRAACAELLPCGLRHRSGEDLGVRLSLCDPHEPFAVSAAMERNELLYAASDFAIVAHARFKEGGTWGGAQSALRKRLCRLIVPGDSGSAAARALASCGAVPLRSPAELESALLTPPIQSEMPWS